MLKLNVEFKGLDKGKNLTVNTAKKVLMKSMYKMEELAVQNAPADRGLLREGITLFPDILSDRYVLTSRAKYSEALEFGTRPYYAPIKPLLDWAGRKFGDESIGYAVRAKIAKFGITAHPFMRPAYWEVKSYWLPTFQKEEFQN